MKRIFTIIAVTVFITVPVISYGQYITAQDDAGNYTSWNNTDNQGFGFSAWDMWTTGNAGFFLGSTATQGFGDIDVDGKAFGMYGNTGEGDYSNAQRLFSNWSDGAFFSVDIAVAFRNGNKGINLYATDFEEIWNFNIGGDTYTAGGVNQTWDYSQTSIFQLTATQNGSDVDISLTRGTDTYSTTISGKTLIGFKFYEGNTEAGDLNNLFFNSLKVGYTDPAKVPATADVHINGDVTLGASQTLTVNDLFVASGNSFTLESTAAGTGSLIINGSCTDEISIQRFLSGNWDWHFLSSPVVDQPIVGADNFIEFTFGTGGDEGDPNVDFYSHDETASENPWINIKDTDGTLNGSFDETFIEKKGYLVAYNGSDVTKSFSGVPFYEATATVDLTYSASGQEGWNLIGNPYPCALDWTVIQAGLIDPVEPLETNTFYIYNQDMNGGAGGFEWFYSNFNEQHSENATEFIPPMQGFYVKRVESPMISALPLPANARAHSTQQYFKKINSSVNFIKFNASNGEYYSSNYVRINETGTLGVDINDAFMLFSYNTNVPHFYTYVEGKKLVSNNVPFPDEDYSIPMGLKTGTAGTYSINAEEIQNFNSSILPILEDTQTGAEIDLRFEGSYTFEVNEPGIDNNRFVLHMKTAVGIDDQKKSNEISVSQHGNELRFHNLESGDYDVKIVDVMGRVLVSGSLSHDNTIYLPSNLSKSAYFLQLSNDGNKYVEKFIVN